METINISDVEIRNTACTVRIKLKSMLSVLKNLKTL